MSLIAAALTTPPVEPNPWMILPFVLMLLSIALLPLVHSRWWENNHPKVAVGLGAIPIFYYLFFLGQQRHVIVVIHEYLSFVALIGSLFVVAGGVHIRIREKSTPLRNTVFLAVGAVLANIVGTTGASMLMIRPWIRTNNHRISAFHVVFFIFIISNAGGALTPIGDPPLFLGYLKGIPFFWTLRHLWIPWLVIVGILLVIFYIADTINSRRAPDLPHESAAADGAFCIEGKRNFWFLAMILGAVFLPPAWSEISMVTAAVASWLTTPRKIHELNQFNFHPVKEVAWLFFGIFGTMIPALDYLQLHSGALGVEAPWQYFTVTGTLSTVLDNAPTYLAFLATALGQQGMSLGDPADVAAFASAHPQILAAISLGAVFFGAATYIGNGPNFMVKSISEHAGIRTPSFFGYVLRFSLPILGPVLALIGWIFFA